VAKAVSEVASAILYIGRYQVQSWIGIWTCQQGSGSRCEDETSAALAGARAQKQLRNGLERSLRPVYSTTKISPPLTSTLGSEEPAYEKMAITGACSGTKEESKANRFRY
jgi:hypothetical protein